MKKITLLLSMLCVACLTASQALAGTQIENTTCQGPSKIYFAKKTFDWKHASAQQALKNPCRATYDTWPTSSDGHADDWAPYSHFYSQLIMEPQESVKATLDTLVPKQAILDNIDRSNPDDIFYAYRITKKEVDRELLRYILFRAFKQSDGTVRVYSFEMVMQADTHYYHDDGKGNGVWKPYHESIPQHARDHFDRVLVQNRADWMKAMHALDTQN